MFFRSFFRYLVAGSAFILLAGAALAREFWLEPDLFFVAPGARVRVRGLLGDNLAGQPWPGLRQRVARLVHLAPGASPAAQLLPPAPAATSDTLDVILHLLQPGAHLLGLVTTETLTTLPAPAFNAYLRARGLDYAQALRLQRGDTTLPGREAYRRCAKTLVQVGPLLPPDPAQTWARPLGLPLELVPEQHPGTLSPGRALTLLVLAEGAPVPGQLVLLWQRQPSGIATFRGQGRSNQNGRLLFRISGHGEYLASTVRTVPAPASFSAADWQSTWSTLTFEVKYQKRL